MQVTQGGNHRKRINRKFIVAATIIGPVLFATEASARRSDREGFNFGTSVRMMDADDRSNASSVSDKTTRTKSNGQAFSPHLGYSFGEINLGLVANVETKQETIDERGANNQQMIRDAQTNTKALSFYGRFNFGKVMFMEAGFGVYNQVSDIHTEYKFVGDGGTFTGKTEDYKVQGIGPGYHVGGGLELPINNGFFFTGSYLVRSFALRDQGKSEFGDKIGSQQKRELSFGLTYYN